MLISISGNLFLNYAIYFHLLYYLNNSLYNVDVVIVMKKYEMQMISDYIYDREIIDENKFILYLSY